MKYLLLLLICALALLATVQCADKSPASVKSYPRTSDGVIQFGGGDPEEKDSKNQLGYGLDRVLKRIGRRSGKSGLGSTRIIVHMAHDDIKAAKNRRSLRKLRRNHRKFFGKLARRLRRAQNRARRNLRSRRSRRRSRRNRRNRRSRRSKRNRRRSN